MTSTLRTVLHDVHETGERTVAATYDPAAVYDQISARAARRRRTVTMVTVVASAACVGLIAIGVGELGAAPSTEPADAVTDHPRLPDSAPLTPEVLQQAGPGWSLVVYDATEFEFTHENLLAVWDHGQSGPAALYLMAPDGTLYLAQEFAPDPERRALSVRSWVPGSTRVLLEVSSTAALDFVTLDLLEGQDVGRFQPTGGTWPALTADGQAVVNWEGGNLTWRDPDGRITAIHSVPALRNVDEKGPEHVTGNWIPGHEPRSVVLAAPDGLVEAFPDGSTRVLAPFPEGTSGCSPLGWAAPEDGLVAQCWTAYEPEQWVLSGTNVWRLSTTGGEPEPLTEFHASSWDAMGLTAARGIEIYGAAQIGDHVYVDVMAGPTQPAGDDVRMGWIVRWDGTRASLASSPELAEELADRFAAYASTDERERRYEEAHRPHALTLRGATEDELLVTPQLGVPSVLAWLDPDTGDADVRLRVTGDTLGVVSVLGSSPGLAPGQ